MTLNNHKNCLGYSLNQINIRVNVTQDMYSESRMELKLFNSPF